MEDILTDDDTMCIIDSGAVKVIEGWTKCV